MSGLADAAKKVFAGDRAEVSDRLDGLTEAIDAADERLDDSLLEAARSLQERASERLQLSGEHTIVALAGATGSGKSSLFNALTDLELAGVGVRRPTTSWALACAWGPDGASELLAWMGIPARHQVSRMSMLDHSASDTKLEGLVLLDLPDHDSTEVSHHVEMERLVEYTDLIIWVLDPQKYADAAIHDRYIKPMAAYSDVTMVVLNQIDRIAYGERERALADVSSILAREGLSDVPVLGVSSTRGDGIDDLKRELVRRIKAKKSAKDRLSSDLSHVARRVANAGGTSAVPGVGDVDKQALEAGLLDSAGVPQLVEAVEASTRRRAARHTGWPVTRWLGRTRKDPLAELGLGDDVTGIVRDSLPSTDHVHRAQAEGAVRELAEKASVGLAPPWRDAVREASVQRTDDVVSALDDAVVGTNLGIARPALWWRLVDAVQWLSLGALVVGLVWLGLLAVDAVAPVDVPQGPEVAGFSLPVVLAVGGLVVGVGLAVLSRLLARVAARSKARRIEERLSESIAQVAHERVLAPVESELERYARYRAGIVRAQS
ncbi:GTPase [Aeromicrobium sp. CTD01-1L150]|uniref:GTPase n=1 Tax=Aeromicrobium sp. CTD01-1L150 TaxID=3341830 RepID=UPI0035C0CC38